MPARVVAPRSFGRRLTLAFLLVAGATAAALAVAAYLMVRQARLDDSLQQTASDTRYQLVLAGQFQPLDDTRAAGLLTSFEGSGRHVVLVTGSGAVASNPAFDPVLGRGLRASVASGRLAFERPATRGPPHLLVVGGRIPGSAAELYVVRTEDRIYDDLGQLRKALAAGWVVVVVLAASVGRLLAGRTLEPVGRASRAARAVAAGLLSTRLPVRGRDEFGLWAASFNDMAAALEENFAALSTARARERRFTADVAHELRTPVTALVAEASLLGERLDELPGELRRPAELLIADVVRLRRLVEELMEISRLDAGGEAVQASRVEVAALLRAIVGARGWAGRVDIEGGPAELHTDPRRLERVLANLLANAVEHGGGQARVTVRVEGPATTITVADRGPGIPAEHLPHIFDRFYKADPSRSAGGSGLGLAIARENALLLGGRLEVHSVVGAGTEFHLRMPVARPLPDGEADDASRGDRVRREEVPP